VDKMRKRFKKIGIFVVVASMLFGVFALSGCWILPSVCEVCEKEPCVCIEDNKCVDCEKEPCVCVEDNRCTDCEKEPCECAEIELLEYKASAIIKLQEFVAELDEDDYTADNWVVIEGFITTGKAAINAATDKAGVDTALTGVKEAIGDVEQKEECLDICDCDKEPCECPVKFEFHRFQLIGSGYIPDITIIKNTNQIENHLNFMQHNYIEDFFAEYYLIVIRLQRFQAGIGYVTGFEVEKITSDGKIYFNAQGPIASPGITIWYAMIIELSIHFQPPTFQYIIDIGPPSPPN